MITLRQRVEAELQSQPDLLYWLHKDLININSLARYLRPKVQTKHGQVVGLESISMTIRRILQDSREVTTPSFRTPDIKNIQVQLHISILTFRKDALINLAADSNACRFLSFAQGQNESMLAVSQEDEARFSKSATRKQSAMAALTITLHGESSDTIGAYGYIVLLLGLAGIPLAEIVTLHDDITLLIADKHVEQAFQLLRHTSKDTA